MARWKSSVAAAATLAASALVIAAAPETGPVLAARKPGAAVAAMETNEQIVADFLKRKQRAEKAQRAIILGLRRDLDRKRAEFEEARRKFDDARGCYVEIVGPLARQGVMNPDDPRLPYEYEMRRWAAEFGESRPGLLSRQPTETGRK